MTTIHVLGWMLMVAALFYLGCNVYLLVLQMRNYLEEENPKSMKARILRWWHKRRGYHVGPAIFHSQQGSESYLEQKCSCGAIKLTEIEGNVTGKAFIEYTPNWAA